MINFVRTMSLLKFGILLGRDIVGGIVVYTHIFQVFFLDTHWNDFINAVLIRMHSIFSWRSKKLYTCTRILLLYVMFAFWAQFVQS